MRRLLVTEASSLDRLDMLELVKTTHDGDLLDPDIFNHSGTFVLKAFAQSQACAYVPVTQPLMLENLIFRPGLNAAQTSQAMTRLAEHAVEEAYRRDSGEVYFLCRDESTCKFAEHHGFTDISTLGLKTYRLNLLEVFGC